MRCQSESLGLDEGIRKSRQVTATRIEEKEPSLNGNKIIAGTL